jgi:signal transduction histidine kinase
MSVRLRSLRVRLLLGSACWVLLALAAAGFAISLLLEDHARRTLESRLDAAMIALMASAEFSDDETLELLRLPAEPDFERVGSGWYWQIGSEEEPLLRSRSLWTWQLQAPDGWTGPGPHGAMVSGPDAEALLVRWRSFTAPGGPQPLTVLVAAPASILAEEVDRIQTPLYASLGLLGLGLLAAVFLQVTVGLRPLSSVRSQLAAVREGKADRLPSTEVAELESLTDEINALLAQSRSVVGRARTHVGNLAHSIKTPLAVLANGVQASGDPAVRALAPDVARLQRLVDYHLRRARAAGEPASLAGVPAVAEVAGELAGLLHRLHAEKTLEIVVDVPAGLRFPGERGDLEELLGNLLDNAAKWCRRQVRVSASLADQDLLLVVEDDGPGMSPAECQRVTGRGVRLDEDVAGHGLGLAITRDLIALYGGRLELGQSALGGLGASVRIPRRAA